jgi:hypothetical protein
MISVWSFYSPLTGVFTGGRFRGPERALEANTPQGLSAYPGSVDASRQRLDIQSMTLVVYAPPRPEDTETVSWTWSDADWAWLPTDTEAAVATKVRQHRDVLLAKCDWVIVKSTETGVAVPPEWATYRQALRDVTEQAGFPSSVEWPQAPGA